MIPIIYFAIAWFVLLGIFVIMSLFSILQMLRFGLAHNGTYAATVGFIGLALLIVLVTLWLLAGIDLNGALDINNLNSGVTAPTL